MSKHYDILLKNGVEEFVVVPINEFRAMQEKLEDEEDFRAIEASKVRQARSRRTPLSKVKRLFSNTRH